LHALLQEGEEAWVMLGRTGSLGAFGPGQDDSEDVSPRALADPDSQFVECGAMTVHVKEAAPPVNIACDDPACFMWLWQSVGTFYTNFCFSLQ
jgi:hypothetical protein